MSRFFVATIGPDVLVCSISPSPYLALERAICELQGHAPVTLSDLERFRLAEPPLLVKPCSVIESSSRTVTLSVGSAIEI